MMKKLNISDLNNSIRFYNLLLGVNPRVLSYNHAVYVSAGNTLELTEGNQMKESDSVAHLQVSRGAFKSAFKNLKSFLNGPQADKCKVLESAFKVVDPDGYEWIVSVKPLTSSAFDSLLDERQCYLEPINF